jgi:hypothetical protein
MDANRHGQEDETEEGKEAAAQYVSTEHAADASLVCSRRPGVLAVRSAGQNILFGRFEQVGVASSIERFVGIVLELQSSCEAGFVLEADCSMVLDVPEVASAAHTAKSSCRNCHPEVLMMVESSRPGD